MEWFVRGFLKASLVWLVAGVTMGVAMAVHPVWTVYRTAHMHMMLLGFVTMMIYGVAYHVIPRFVGFPLYSRRASVIHLWISNAGLALMVAGFVTRASYADAGTVVLSTGGTLSAVGAYLFAYVIWRTLDGPRALQRAKRDDSTKSRRAVALPIA